MEDPGLRGVTIQDLVSPPGRECSVAPFMSYPLYLPGKPGEFLVNMTMFLCVGAAGRQPPVEKNKNQIFFFFFLRRWHNGVFGVKQLPL